MYRRYVFSVIVAILLLSSLSSALTNDEQAQAVLTKAATALEWSTSINSSGESTGTAHSYTISETGSSSDDLHATIAVFSTEQEPQLWMSFLTQETDAEHSSYQGRDAAISTFGQNCNPKPLVKALNDMFNGFFSSIFGESNDTNSECVTDTGSITWTCGDYMFSAGDDSTDPDNAGRENNIAAALYGAAQSAGLCEYGDTLVIMADTPDLSGTAQLSDIMNM